MIPNELKIDITCDNDKRRHSYIKLKILRHYYSKSYLQNKKYHQFK